MYILLSRGAAPDAYTQYGYYAYYFLTTSLVCVFHFRDVRSDGSADSNVNPTVDDRTLIGKN